MPLVITEKHHAELQRHLHGGDGLESAAVLLCSLSEYKGSHKLFCRHVFLIPNEKCVRTPASISWPSAQIEAALESAGATDVVPILIHAHPNGYWGFSEIDNCSDGEIIPYLQEENRWELAGSAVMMPDGSILCRTYRADGVGRILDSVQVIGSSLVFFFSDRMSNCGLAYSSKMTALLNRLSVCVVGVSGTGSIIAEQVGRLGFGKIVLVDPDRIERRNLNRVLSASTADAESGALKAFVAAQAIKAHRAEVNTLELNEEIGSVEAVLEAGHADVVFCCVDSASGRMICDLIAAYFMVPLIDMGVTIPVTVGDIGPEIADVIGRVDFVHPKSASLRDRGVYDQNALRTESLEKSAPEQLKKELVEGYITGAHDEAPSVISLNMQAAAIAVNEFIARCFQVRFDDNAKFARTIFSLSEMETEHYSDEYLGARITPAVTGLGDAAPLLGLPGLQDQRSGGAI